MTVALIKNSMLTGAHKLAMFTICVKPRGDQGCNINYH